MIARGIPADERRRLALAIVAGVGLGAAYTLSPLTVLCAGLLLAAACWAGEGLSPRERRWFAGLLVIAVALRLCLIAGIVLFADRTLPYGTLFGDEQLFKSRTLWMRNIGMGLPISPADFIYAFEDVGESSYLYFLALVQALVGEAPYGIHVLNTAFYVTGVLIVYRWVRPAYGKLPALAGLGLLLFFPSLLIWSASALKEPSYTLMAVGELACVIAVARATRWRRRLLGALGVVAGVVALESLRRGGGVSAGIGAAGALLGAAAATRPRVLAGAIVALPVAAAVMLATPAIYDRALGLARSSATYHAGHVQSSGYSYKILDGRYYRDRRLIAQMPPREAAAFVVRSAVSYVTEPVPWRSESPAMRAYLPEQVVWFVVLALAPVGLWAGLRRDAVLTSALAAHAVSVMMIVALTSGNIGTLIRHRGLALSYLAWLAGLGAYEAVRAAVGQAWPSEEA